MDSSNHLLIAFTICFSFFLTLSPTSAAAITDAAPSKLVEVVCSHEPSQSEHSFCIQVLGSDPKANTATNLVDLAKIILQIAVSNATVTRDYIRNLIKSHPPKNETLGLCLGAYEQGVIAEFRGAIGELKIKDYLMANYACKIAGDEGMRCDNLAVSAGIQDSSIKAGNEYVQKFSVMGLTVTDLLD